jgi:thiosulfate/3-mercaptopyruvate sulfurtransferase
MWATRFWWMLESLGFSRASVLDGGLDKWSAEGRVIINALSPQSHKGLEPSRYGRPGRIPGSVNVPASTLYDPANKTFANPADAERQFVAQGVTKKKQVIAYCGEAFPRRSICCCSVGSATEI